MEGKMSVESLNPQVFFQQFLSDSEKMNFNECIAKASRSYALSPSYDEVSKRLLSIYQSNIQRLHAAICEMGSFREFCTLFTKNVDQFDPSEATVQQLQEYLKTLSSVSTYLAKYSEMTEKIYEEYKTGINYFRDKIQKDSKYLGEESTKADIDAAKKQLTALESNFHSIEVIKNQFIERLQRNAQKYYNDLKKKVAAFEQKVISLNPTSQSTGWLPSFLKFSISDTKNEPKCSENTPKEGINEQEQKKKKTEKPSNKPTYTQILDGKSKKKP
jgi:DNA repair ATPase RecN